jgi:hypothetical protein
MSLLRFHAFCLFLSLCFFAWGQERPFRAAVASEDGFIAVGECFARLDPEGVILYEKPLEQPAVALCLWQGRLLALQADGSGLLELDAKGDVRDRLPAPAARGRLRDLSSDGSWLVGVTDEGEIVRSQDGFQWTVLDFNASYEGYYPRMDFRCVAAGSGSIMVAGVGEDGLPAAFVSSRGTVWSARSLEAGGVLPSSAPEGLDYDAQADSFFLSFADGGLLTLPGCTHCNAWEQKVPGPLYARVRGNYSVLHVSAASLLILPLL